MARAGRRHPFRDARVIEWASNCGSPARLPRTHHGLEGGLGPGHRDGEHSRAATAYASQALQAIVTCGRWASPASGRCGLSAAWISPAKIEQNMANRSPREYWGLRGCSRPRWSSPSRQSWRSCRRCRPIREAGHALAQGCRHAVGAAHPRDGPAVRPLQGLENTPGYVALKSVLRNLSDVSTRTACRQGTDGRAARAVHRTRRMAQAADRAEGKKNNGRLLRQHEAGIDTLCRG